MKIAIDARIVFTSTGRYVERLLYHLQDLDDKNEYLVLLLKKDMEAWQPRVQNFTKIEADFPPYGLAEQRGFLKLLNSLKADLVHFTMPQHPVLYTRPHIVTIHDLTLVDFVNRRKESWARDFYKQVVKPAAFRLVVSRAVQGSKAVITPTEYVRQELIRRFGAPGGRVHVTPEAADPLAAQAKEAHYGQGKDYLMYVGNAYPYKNLWTLIEAFRALHRHNLKLVLVGKQDYFYQEMERRTKAAGIEGVIFAGFVPDDELRWLFEHAKLYVFPSLSEGFGLPPLEAMEYGLPVLSSNASCLPEVYGEAVEYFDPRSTTELTEAMDRLLDNGPRLKELAEAGKKRVGQFSWARMSKHTLDLYRRFGRK